MRYDTLDVPVRGGTLHVGRWRPEHDGGDLVPTAVAAHGITANHLAWTAVARRVTEAGVTLAAPDLRGRGDSAGLPGPYGMHTHADDLLAVLDHLDVDTTTVVGHSMGGFVAAAMATRHADRVRFVVLVDGGLALAAPQGTDVDAALQSVIGPALERLRMTFPSRAAYHDFWRAHPALAGAWTADTEAYVDHDLTGEAPELRSKVRLEAVREDGADILGDAATAVERVTQPVVLLWADHGMLGQPGGLYDEERLASLAPVPATKVAGTNHYTILTGEQGATAVAEAVVRAAAARR